MAIELSWSIPDSEEPITHYYLYKKIGTSLITESDLYAVFPLSQTSFSDDQYTKAILESDGYSYQIRASTRFGLGQHSNQIHITYNFHNQ